MTSADERRADLKATRHRLRLSQREMAALLPVARRTLEDWEAGPSGPPAYLPRALRDLERELAATPPTPPG